MGRKRKDPADKAARIGLTVPPELKEAMEEVSRSMTISVPKTTRVKMNAADCRVNWSAVAAKAFEAEITRLIGAGRANHAVLTLHPVTGLAGWDGGE